MRRFSMLCATVVALTVAAVTLLGGQASAAAASCTLTGFMRDGINMTAAQIGGNVTGSLDAGGCNIGVYYDSTTGNVTGADIFGANYFGVVVNGDVGTVTVNVTGSTHSRHRRDARSTGPSTAPRSTIARSAGHRERHDLR